MRSTLKFQHIQRAFAAHIRDPEHHALPADVEDRRMAIYRALFYNNIEEILARGFPVLHSLHASADWRALVRGFFAEHRCRSPYFKDIGQAFVEFLQDRPQRSGAGWPPFAAQLAHYEWVEAALSLAPDEPPLDEIDPEGDLLTGYPAVSPLAWLLTYQYPVHRISSTFKPEAPDPHPHCFLICRNREDRIRFTELNAVTARLIVLLKEHPGRTGQAALDEIVAELNHPRPDVVYQGGLQILGRLYEMGAILGTWRRPAGICQKG